jgi:Uma2 family endonuclease
MSEGREQTLPSLNGKLMHMLDVSLLFPERPRGLKRVEYERLVALGAFDEEKIELLDGVIVEMSRNDVAHDNPIQQLNQLLLPALLGRAIVRVQLSLIAAGESIPVPDLAIVPLQSYKHAHPDFAYAVIEVASSSLRKDRKIKSGIYARSGFPEYLIVNAQTETVEVFRRPVAGEYAVWREHCAPEVLTLDAFPDVTVPIARLFE